MKVYGYTWDYATFTNIDVFVKTDKVPMPKAYNMRLGTGIIDPEDIIDADDYPIITVKKIDLHAIDEDDFDYIITSPRLALAAAISRAYPNERDRLRAKACEDPFCALRFARTIDKYARDDTRTAACTNRTTAIKYAQTVDAGYHHDTLWKCAETDSSLWKYMHSVTLRNVNEDIRKAALLYPKTAAAYAYFTKAKDDEIREAACREPKYALLYAYDIGCIPEDETRTAVCGDPMKAYCYALHIDRCPSDETREAACMDYEYGVRYLAEIDNFGYSDCMARFLNSSKKARSFLRIHFSEAAKIDWFSAILEKYP